MPTPNEFRHIAWIRERIAADSRVIIGPGDDAALVQLSAGGLLATVDMLLEGVHFSFEEATPMEVGRKAMNVNLSDIAAMAGKPLFALLAVGLPAGSPKSLAEGLFAGLKEAADRFGVSIIGGDTNSSKSGVVVSVTVLGEPHLKGVVTRAGAKPADALMVTGRLGYSRHGKHLSFTPRIEEARRLHEGFRITAMMDLSDGLGGDVFHLTGESGVGALIEADAIPIADGPADGRLPLDHALSDGEDFELLFTTPTEDAERLMKDQPLAYLGVQLTRIGTVAVESGVRLRQGGVESPLEWSGFVHGW
jgi:thiamine-monophosphate kinase